MKISIEINGDKRIIEMFGQFEKKMANPAKELKKVGDFAITEFSENFPMEGRRLDEPWKKLAASTIRQRAKLGYGPHPILVRTKTLMKGFRKDVQKMLVRVYNPVEYFKYHQRGGGNLPQRRMIIATEKIKQEIVSIFADFLRNITKV